jgi:tetratricopeptide (TPR) repeat protein
MVKTKYNPRLILLLLFLFALFFRLGYLIAISDDPYFTTPLQDEAFYLSWAHQIADGAWLGSEPFERAPLYAYLLAFLLNLFGDGEGLARIVQLVISSLSAPLVYLLAMRTTSNRAVAIASAVLVSINAALIFFEAQFLVTSTVIVLSLLFLHLLLKGLETGAPKWLAISGVFLGLAILARPNALIALVFVVAWLALLAPRPRLRAVLLVTLCALAVVGIATVSNFAVSGDFVLVSVNGGINLYIGNNPSSDGRSARVPELGGHWNYSTTVRMAEEETGRDLSPSEVSNFFVGKAIRFAREEPGDFIKLQARKIYYLISNSEISNNRDISHSQDSSWFLKLFWVPFGVILPFAALGKLAGLKRDRFYSLIVFYVIGYAISILAFFVCSRFRAPLLPFLSIMAVYGVVQLHRWFLGRDRLKALAGIALVVAVGLVSNLPLLPQEAPSESISLVSEGWANYRQGDLRAAYSSFAEAVEADRQAAPAHYGLGIVLLDMGRSQEARVQFERAIEIDQSFPEPHTKLGVILASQGRFEDAIQEHKSALRLNPSLTDAEFDLGWTYIQAGRLREAEETFASLIQRYPRLAEARVGVGAVSEARGNLQGALTQFERALELDPGLDDARNRRAIVLHKLGRTREAIAEWERLLEKYPDSPAIKANLEMARGG